MASELRIGSRWRWPRTHARGSEELPEERPCGPTAGRQWLLTQLLRAAGHSLAGVPTAPARTPGPPPRD